MQYVEEPPSKPHRQKPHRPMQFGATPEPIIGRQHMDGPGHNSTNFSNVIDTNISSELVEL